MPEITVSEDTLERLDELADPGQSYDELISELLDIYEAESAALHTPDEGA